MTPQAFLRELKEHHKTHFAIVSALRILIQQVAPDAREEIKYGGLYYSTEKPFAGIFVYAHHVALGFTHGAQLADPEKLLVGTGKQRRHIKFATVSDIDEAAITQLLAGARKR
jgi:hypothetical protein